MISNNSYTANKLKQDRANENYRLHKIISSIKPSIQRHSSLLYPHIRNNSKKKQIQEERYTEIERENRFLLEKIHGIMSKRSFINKNASTISPCKHYVKKSSKRLSNRSRYSMGESDDLLRFQSNQSLSSIASHSNQPTKKIVFEGSRTIESRIFSVKILQFGDQLQILAENSNDTYILKLGFLQALSIMKGYNNWNIILDSLHMECEKLVLYQNPAY